MLVKNLTTQIQRILKRVDRELSGPLALYSEQFLYGHREIFIHYGGFSYDTIFEASIEHGWALDSGYGMRRLNLKRNLHLSWSSDRIERSQIRSSKTIAVGAPFIYAAKLMESAQSKNDFNKPVLKRDILFFPVHGNEHGNQNVADQIELFTNLYPPERAVVCLYWVEFVDFNIRNFYLSRGFEVECVGFSGQMENTGLGYSSRILAGSLIGGRPLFIPNTIALLNRFNKIVSGRLGTICLYAAFLGKELEILHGYEKSNYYEWDFEQPIKFGDEPTETRYRQFFENSLGAKFQEIDFSGDDFRELARRELGVHNMKSSHELHSILGPYSRSGANKHSSEVFSSFMQSLS